MPTTPRAFRPGHTRSRSIVLAVIVSASAGWSEGSNIGVDAITLLHSADSSELRTAVRFVIARPDFASMLATHWRRKAMAVPRLERGTRGS